ncbi:MAG: hypothetical protein A2182_02410 [Candidatus Pacebacteria bacterium RIFOXYA1_FULL_38_18]|nr:MAG: hypothetical protein A2182_02410 [Candidatus Pacebacteria bacterium RIFOXYA1_FULL_38_18]OGJ40800.1 MAG: hypothetical protein A2411_00740 [Candidatus Pacebacteria bacterium RIFOXYC1_FULL_39_21]
MNNTEKILRKFLRSLSRAQEKKFLKKFQKTNKKKQQRNLKQFWSPQLFLILLLVVLGSGSIEKGEQMAECEFSYPVPGRTAPNGSWGFGEPTNFQTFHTGEDYMGSLGETIVAASSGTVVWNSWWPPEHQVTNTGHGNTVVIETYCGGDPVYHYYAHLAEISVSLGQKVEMGSKIGQMGMTGAGEGVHLHFALTSQHPAQFTDWSNWLDPSQFIQSHAHAGKSETKSLLWTVPGYLFFGIAILSMLLQGINFQKTIFGSFWGIIKSSLFPGLILALLILVIPLSAVKTTTLQIKSQVVDNTLAERITGKCEVSADFPTNVLRWCELITHYALENGLSPDLVAALILQESGGDPDAISSAGAVGLTQVMPREATSFVNSEGVPLFADRPSAVELLDPEFNIRFGTQYLADLIRIYGSTREALLHYGPSGVGYSYADAVLGLKQQYGK